MKIGKINLQSIAISSFTSVLNCYEHMPSELYVAGKLPKERIPAVAVVGSRKPTHYGEEVTYKLAYELARAGVVIISGLAYGIDAIAHKAALDAGGTTIAVLAGGLHRIYPPAHQGLAEEIIRSGGAIISEQPMGMEAHKFHFLSRNRLVSGLADAVIVTEATDKSGTFSTVAHAISQNKEVFAVPGPVTSLLSAGPNRLIQDGVHVVLQTRDVLDVIAPQLQQKQTRLALGSTPLETEIITHIQKGISSGEALLAAIKAPVSEVLQAMTMLELNGVIRPTGGNHWQVR